MFFSKKKKNEKTITPEDLANKSANDMDDSEFSEYISIIRNGGSVNSDKPTEAEDKTEESTGAEKDSPNDKGSLDIAKAEEKPTGAEEKPTGAEKDSPNDKGSLDNVAKAIDEASSTPDLNNDVDQARRERMDEIVRGFYGDDEGGIDKLYDDLEEQLANSQGISLDEYKNNFNEKMKKAHEKKQKEYNDSVQSLVDMWVRDAGNLKVIVPEFDLKSSLDNEEFKNALLNGGDVFSAYRDVFAKDNTGAEEKPTEKDSTTDNGSLETPEEGEAIRPSIDQNGQAPKRGSGNANLDISKLSSKDFNEYIKKLRG